MSIPGQFLSGTCCGHEALICTSTSRANRPNNQTTNTSRKPRGANQPQNLSQLQTGVNPTMLVESTEDGRSCNQPVVQT